MTYKVFRFNDRKFTIIRGITSRSFDDKGKIISSGLIELPFRAGKIFRVWILFDEKSVRKVGPVHFKNSFLEDKMHDWDYVDNNPNLKKIRWFSHAMEPGQTGELLIELKE